MTWGDFGSGLGAVAGGVGGFALGGPMGAGLGMAAGGALGNAVGGWFDEDGNPAPPPAYVDPSLYTTPGYDQYLQGVGGRQDYYGGRAAPTMDWSMANADHQLALQARDVQGEAIQSYRDVLSGKSPSLPQQQLQQGLATAQAQQAQQAASVRGGGGNALLAAQNAQRTGAGMALATGHQAAQLRAQEMNLARQGLLQGGTQMRGQDLDMRGQSQGQTQMTAQNELAQRGLNDAMIRQLEQNRMAALSGQQAAKGQYASDKLAAQQGNAQSAFQQQQAAQAQRNREQDYQRQLVGGVMQQGGSLAAMGMEEGKNSNRAPADEEWASAWKSNGGGDWPNG